MSLYCQLSYFLARLLLEFLIKYQYQYIPAVTGCRHTSLTETCGKRNLCSHTHTHTHSCLMALCLGLPGWAVPEQTFTHSHLKSSISVAGGLSSFWILRGVGKIIEAKSGWTPPHPDRRCLHLHHPPSFTLDALPAETLPIYLRLGQAPNTLDYIPGTSVTFIARSSDQ